jgi:hypothetical protein
LVQIQRIFQGIDLDGGLFWIICTSNGVVDLNEFILEIADEHAAFICAVGTQMHPSFPFLGKLYHVFCRMASILYIIRKFMSVQRDGRDRPKINGRIAIRPYGAVNNAFVGDGVLDVPFSDGLGRQNAAPTDASVTVP